jgi:phosphopantothenoylcysteine decarboxylase/phosphopantothenate--cysteine ligase
MHCVVTAGPTCEPLDEVRRLTNFSTGRLGGELAAFLTAHGHEVTLLLGEQATWRGARLATRVTEFSTTANLREHLHCIASRQVDAVFHAAAVSDFRFGKISTGEPGSATEITGGKIPSRNERLFAELIPTPKILMEMRDLFPCAKLIGWKYEVDGARTDALIAAERQLRECRTDACVTNGRAYGEGFGLVTSPGHCTHLANAAALYEALENLLRG